MKKKTSIPATYREPTEEKKAELAAVLEKVSQRRSAAAKKKNAEFLLEKARAEKDSATKTSVAPKDMNAHLLKPGQFVTFEAAFFFFHTERRMTKGAAIKQAAREYPVLHDDYVSRLEAGATLPLNGQEG